MSCLRGFLTFLVLSLTWTSGSLPAQTASQLGQQIAEEFDKGNYAEAAKKAEEFLNRFRMNPDAPSAMYVAGVSYFALNDFAKAKEKLAEAAKLGDPKTIKPLAQFYLARTSLVEAEKETDPAKKTALLNTAIEQFNTILKENPDTDLKTEILMSRAVIFVQLKKFDQAQKELEDLKTVPGTGMTDDIDYLLGWVYAQRADLLLSEFRKEEADEMIEKARSIYTKLADGDNLAVANEASFQLARLDVAAQKYEEAIEKFRNLRSKADIVRSQEDRLNAARDRLRAAGSNLELVKRIQREVQREQQKLDSVKSAPELAVDALIQIGDSYLQLRKLDEARTVYRHAIQFASEEQKKLLRIQIIISKAVQGLTAEADKDFESFRSEFPKDPMAQTVDYLIGRALLGQKKYEEAIEKFNKSLSTFPESPVSGEIPKWLATAYQALNKPEEAVNSYVKFISDAKAGKIRVPKESIEDAERLLAVAYMQTGKTDEALKTMKQVSETATTASVKEAATFAYADMLNRAKKPDLAVPAYQAFVTAFPESQQAPNALYQAALILAQGTDLDKTVAAFRNIISKYPDSSQALAAHEQIWRAYQKARKTEEMLKAQDDMIAKYPKSDRIIFALAERGKYYREMKTSSEEEKVAAETKALEAYRQIADLVDSLVKAGMNPSNAALGQAAVGLIFGGDILVRRATGMGDYGGLDATRQADWLKLQEEALTFYRKAVLIFGGSPPSATATQRLQSSTVQLVRTGVWNQERAIQSFSELAADPAVNANPAARIQVLVAQAGVPFELGSKQQAGSLFEAAMKDWTPAVPLSWNDLDRYGSILMENNKLTEAAQVYGVLREFRIGNRPVEQAQASGTYGLGVIAQKQGKGDEASKLFEELSKRFPWSDKIAEIEFLRGIESARAGRHDDAFEQWAKAIGHPRSTNELKSQAHLEIGKLLNQLGNGYNGKLLKDPKGQPLKNNDGSNLRASDLAVNYLIKIDLLYGSALPEASAEALHLAAQIQIREKKTDEARRYLNAILSKYGQTSWVSKARELLATIPAS